jgi:hypothetical protein
MKKQCSSCKKVSVAFIAGGFSSNLGEVMVRPSDPFLHSGETARFWTDRWLDRQAQKDIAPLCFHLAARKKLTVKQALDRGRWMGGLQRIANEDQLLQFITLWTQLQRINLHPHRRDSIVWNLTTDGKYSARSAYEVQFIGRISKPHLEQVWKIRADGKVQFFLWLFLQNRKWTAERLRARGLAHDDECSLCDQELETAKHLALHCPYTKEVWAQFATTNPKAVRIAATCSTVSTWWNKLRRGKMDETKKREVAVSVYTVWHIWKERGRRIFDHKQLNPQELAGLIRADLAELHLAKGRAV